VSWKLVDGKLSWVCDHPETARVWPSNWQWRCEVCQHVEDVPDGAIGSVRKVKW